MRRRLAPESLSWRRTPLATPGRALSALALSLVFLTPPASAAADAPRLLPSGHRCANNAHHNEQVAGTPVFALRGLTGNAGQARLLCADLRHLDNRHTPTREQTDIAHLVACIRRATGPAVSGIGQTGPNPPAGGAGTVYTVNGVRGNAPGVPNSAGWVVVVNTQTQRITSVYNNQPGHNAQNPSRRSYADCA